MLTVVLRWPDEIPLHRERLGEMLSEVTYAPDEAMLAPVIRGDSGGTNWGDMADAKWKVS